MRKFLFLFSCVATGFTTILAQNVGGSCGENATWTLDGNTLYIEGTGSTTDYLSFGDVNLKFPAWEEYKDNIKSVVIGKGITSIGDFSFYKYNNLESVSLPEGLIRIGNYTFAYCSSLNSIVLPESIETIGYKLGWGRVGFSFAGCITLEEVTMPERLTLLGLKSFSGCENLKKVNWNSINCEADVAVFEDTSIEEVNFGPKVRIVPQSLFENVQSLGKINTCGSIEYVGGYAFRGTLWESFQEPEKVIYIDTAAYMYGERNDYKEPYSIVFKEGTTGIANYIFNGSSRIKEVTIPETVTLIGRDAFHNCSNLNTVKWNAINLNYSSDSEDRHYLFGPVLTSIIFGEKVQFIPDMLLNRCSSLTQINLPQSLRYIGEEAISYCSSITELIIPDNVETIEERAVQNCDNLQKVTIGEGVKNINGDIFGLCNSLKTIEWKATNCSSLLFNNRAGEIVNLIIGDKVLFVPGSIINNSRNSIENVTMGNSVRKIGRGAFENCKSLKSIVLPQSLQTIEEYALKDTGIDFLIIPEKMDTLGSCCFGGSSYQTIIYSRLQCPINDYSSGGIFNASKDLVLYVPDVDQYSESSRLIGVKELLQPFAIPNITNYTLENKDIPLQFTCNIPEYTMEVTEIPELSKEFGEHEAIIYADFFGKQNFSASFVYKYNVSFTSDVELIEDAEELVDVYSFNGVMLKNNINKSSLHLLAPGIYIIKKGSKFYKTKID